MKTTTSASVRPTRRARRSDAALPDHRGVTFTYGTLQGNGDGGFLTVGAENRFGNSGANYYFNGTGTLPTAGGELRVTGIPGAPGGTRTITFSAKGKSKGDWTNCAHLVSNAYFGAQTACTSGTVTK